VPSYHLPHSTNTAMLGNNFSTKSSQEKETSQLAGVSPSSLVLHSSLDKQGCTAQVELPLEVRQQVLGWRRGDGAKLIQSLVHPVEDVSQDTGSAPLPGHDVHQPVKAGQVDSEELGSALMPILNLVVL